MQLSEFIDKEIYFELVHNRRTLVSATAVVSEIGALETRLKITKDGKTVAIFWVPNNIKVTQNGDIPLVVYDPWAAST